MSKLFLSLILGSLLFTACRKERFEPIHFEAKAPCLLQTESPLGRSYDVDSIIQFNCTQNYCGLIPLSTKNYWIYEDSIFSNGVFLRVQMDTLRFTKTYQSTKDGLVWWEGNMSVGLPAVLYANDSTFFGLNYRMFNPDYKDVKKEYGLFEGDSIKYLTSFEDNAAIGLSLKLTDDVLVPAGAFGQCLLFEKNAKNYRRDRIIYSRGIGVVKYIYEKAPVGTPTIKLQKVSTLVAYHIE